MKLSNLTYITLWAVNYDSMVEFYVEKLGLEVVNKDGDFAQLKTDTIGFNIHRIKDPHTKLAERETVEIHFAVEDVDRVYEELKEKGIVFDSEPGNMPWGVRMIACKDPEGYSVEFVGPLK